MGKRHKYVMWFVLTAVLFGLGALIVAIAREVRMSTWTSIAILVASAAISVVLMVTASRLATARHPVVRAPAARTGAAWVDAGKVANWVFLADAHVKRREYDAAEKLYRRAVEAGHLGAAARLGAVLRELGRDAEAEYFGRLGADAVD